MRWYILGNGVEKLGLPPYVIAEVAVDMPIPQPPGEDPNPAERGGTASTVEHLRADYDYVSEDELRAMPGGPDAIAAWKAGDDSAHYLAEIRWQDRISVEMLEEHPEDPQAGQLLAHGTPLERFWFTSRTPGY
jgi:hypothetical protein